MKITLSCRLCLGAMLLAVGLAGQADYKSSLIGRYPFYKTATGRFAPVYPALAQQMVQDYGITEGVCVDLGGGCGSLAMELAKISNLTVYALDIDPVAVRLCGLLVDEAGLTGRVRPVEGDAQNLPFRDSSADLVVSRGSIFFWPDQFAGVTEAYRVLKPGGVALIGGCFSRLMDPKVREELVRWRSESGKDKAKSGWRPLDAGLVEKARAAGIAQVRLISDGPEESWLEIRKPGPPLVAYSADSIKPALDEAVLAYQRDTGIEVKVTYCKVKQAYERARKDGGDLFFSGHGDAYETAKQQGLALEGSQRILGNLRLALAVRKGNPLGIKELADLAKPGMKVGLGDPETAQLGRVSEEMLKKAGLADAIHANVVARGDCCSTTAALLTAGKVDMELGWADFAQRAPAEIETIPLPADLASPLPVTGLVLTTSVVPGRARAFLSFLAGDRGKAIFATYGYAAIPEAAAR